MKIVFNCICGNRHELALNPSQKCYSIGSNEPDNTLNLCRDDKRMLSRRQCHIRFINNSWVLFDGCPSDCPMPAGKSNPLSACGTYLKRENKILQIPNEKGIALQMRDEIYLVPSKIPVTYKGVEVPPRGGFLYSGAVIETLKPEEIKKDIDELVKNADVKEIEPAPECIKERFGEIYDLTRQIANDIENTDKVLNTILDYVKEKIPAVNAAAILEYNPYKNEFNSIKSKIGWKDTQGFRYSAAISGMVLEKKKPIISGNIQKSIELQMFCKKQMEGWKEKGQLGDIPSLGQSIEREGIESLIVIPLFEQNEIIGLFWLDNRGGDNGFTELDFYLAVAISNLIQLQLLYKKYKSLAKLTSNMERFFSPDTLNWIQRRIKTGKDVKLNVHEFDITILFVDIEGSTQLSRDLTPKQFYEYLTPHYYETISETVFHNNGHVNSFIGDGVMATFGNLVGDEEVKTTTKEYAIAAVKSGLEIIKNWKEVRQKNSLPESMKIRIGINTGRAVVGNIGYEKRMEFSALGKDVNLASRLEKFADQDGLVISDATYQFIKDKFQCEDLGEKEIKGISEGETGKLRLWKVVGENK